jgi:hypothetical protein
LGFCTPVVVAVLFCGGLRYGDGRFGSLQRERAYLGLRTCQRCAALRHPAGLITITGSSDHVRPESVITFRRNR